MTILKAMAPAKTRLRCGIPDCDWGTPLPGFSDWQWSRCRRQFREHCIERHGLDPSDFERLCWFNLEVLTMTLLEDGPAWQKQTTYRRENSLSGVTPPVRQFRYYIASANGRS